MANDLLNSFESSIIKRRDLFLVKSVLSGNKDSFAKLISLYKKRIFSLGMSFFRNETDTEDFIQDVQFDLFSVELVIGDTATLLLAENYVTIREVFVDGVKVEPNENKQIFLTSGGDNLLPLIYAGL